MFFPRMRILLIHTLVILYYVSVVISMTISPCAKWSRAGITAAGTGQAGSLNNELNWPSSLSFHKQTNTLYVADSLGSRIQAFTVGQLPLKGNTAASVDGDPKRIYVDDDDGPKIYVSYSGSRPVEKWIPLASSGDKVGDECDRCLGLSMDAEKNIYMSSSEKQRVFKWSPRTKTTTSVAGQINQTGSINQLLFDPQGISVDKTNGAVYVVDASWHRVQKWPKGAHEGITVAGSNVGEDSNNPESLVSPNSVFVDEETKVLYIADVGNNRIQKWLPNAIKGETIAGGWGKGNNSNQLDRPNDLAFDNEGNLYVADSDNHRVQLFKIINNEPCPDTSTNGSETAASSRAGSSHWNQYTSMSRAIPTLTIVIWFIAT